MLTNFIRKFSKVEEKIEHVRKEGKHRFVIYEIDYFKTPDAEKASMEVDVLFVRDGECFFEAYEKRGFFKLEEVVAVTDIPLSSIERFNTRNLMLFIGFYNMCVQHSFSSNVFERLNNPFAPESPKMNVLKNRATNHPGLNTSPTKWRRAVETRGEYQILYAAAED